MSGKNRGESGAVSGQIMSAFAGSAKAAENLGFSPAPLGQRYPTPCPDPYPLPNGATASAPTDPLGEPMSIREVARMFGCSEWTVRQQYVPRGLPCFRLSPAGKLLFFHNQIVRWVLERQNLGSPHKDKQGQKGGIFR